INMNSIFKYCLTVCILAVMFGSSLAVDAEDFVLVKIMRAVQIIEKSPVVDGKLDDPVWKRALFVSNFIQKEPDEGIEPEEKTEVAIVYDEHSIYVGARMYSRDVGSIPMLITKRDLHGNTEQISVTFDSYHDKRTGYGFGVTASGVRFDRYYPEDVEWNKDYSYNPIWEANTSVDSNSWTAEMRIPFSQLRFNKIKEQIWGVNLNRWVPSRNEDDYWIIVPKDSTGWASRFGELVGMKDIKPSRRIEILPYVAGDGEISDEYDKDNPFEEKADYSGRIGADLKMGLGPNLTLDAAFNPDFGQVEADPAEVNLSAYETYFDERRPFFIEGSQLFKPSSFFYSRRIGAAPHSEPDGDYVDVPQSSSILGAAKVTGRLRSGLSLAALAAVTEREYAQSYDEQTGVQSKIEVEPATFYGVTKLKQEFGEERSTVGLMFTGVKRDISDTDGLSAVLRKQAFSGVADYDILLKDGEYNINGIVGMSFIQGSKESIANTQKASAHYFQRPDSDYLTYDSNRTSLTGYVATLSVERSTGRHWLWSVYESIESPKLDLNDAGTTSSANDIETYCTLNYRENLSGSFYYRYDIALKFDNGWNFDGDKQFTSLRLNPHIVWNNFWDTYFALNYNFRTQNDGKTRGGPSMGTPHGGWFAFGFNNSHSATTNYGIEYDNSWDELGSYGQEFDLEYSTRIGNHWQISINPAYYKGTTARQYVTTLDNGPDVTFGKRYIFSWIERSEVSAEIRLNYFINPDLSIEVYAEPFASSGRYYDHGELNAPRSFELREYGSDGTSITRESDGSYTVTDDGETFTIPDRDYNYLSFRSNLVLKWEFTPGSTLYLIWQLNREEDTDSGKNVKLNSLFDSTKATGSNFIGMKVSYWLSIN
ncbi:MAG: carbohydrate binding family 9 domain-containing protein, partial [candidate division Zixibacteria bacterium]|nr:carbohydrate binding family 9 domain-containing protein [candidate division Zixibacteria bacterium]